MRDATVPSKTRTGSADVTIGSSMPDPGGYSHHMIEFDDHTALIVVDVQNDFADPEGSLAVEGGVEVVPLINELRSRAAEAGGLVVYTADWHPESTPHFEKDGGVWPVHCVAGGWGADFHPDLVVEGPVVRKGSNGEDGYSGFTMRDPESGETAPTQMIEILEEHGIERLVVTGLATDYCVKATVLDGLALGYPVAVVRDAVRSVDLEPRDGIAALLEVCLAGAEIV
jgi:nicotinamidase/pyrazinamidase